MGARVPINGTGYREQLVRQRTMLVNALRAHLAEFGIVAAQGLRNSGRPGKNRSWPVFHGPGRSLYGIL